jgi:hypothetical protein
MARLRMLLLLAWTACGFMNPLGETRDGNAPRTRLRIGISAATLAEDCSARECSVQVEMGHFENEPLRVDVVAVRLLVGGVELGAVPSGEPLRWRRGEYRAWDHVVEPSRSTKLSLPIGPFEWEKLLAPLGGEPNPDAHDFTVEVDVAVDGEQLTVQSIFTIETVSSQVFVVT